MPAASFTTLHPEINLLILNHLLASFDKARLIERIIHYLHQDQDPNTHPAPGLTTYTQAEGLLGYKKIYTNADATDAYYKRDLKNVDVDEIQAQMFKAGYILPEDYWARKAGLAEIPDVFMLWSKYRVRPRRQYHKLLGELAVVNRTWRGIVQERLFRDLTIAPFEVDKVGREYLEIIYEAQSGNIDLLMLDWRNCLGIL